jgi:hypothetical protein
MRYEVYFLYNGRGKMALEWVLRCELPEGIGPELLSHGFWIDDTGIKPGLDDVSWASTLEARRMWVPPGRITSVLPVES